MKSEQKQFETWAKKVHPTWTYSKSHNGAYLYVEASLAFEAWEARADLSTTTALVATKTPQDKPNTDHTWYAYSEAYKRRYGAYPVRNASVNSMMLAFVKRIGAADAPAVADSYLAHQGFLYVRAMHPVKLLLADAEKLHTEWVIGRQMTQAKATLLDRTQSNWEVFGPMMQQAREHESNARNSGNDQLESQERDSPTKNA